MITYNTNWMGPVNLKWIEEHGDNWMAGRIDMYGESLGNYDEAIGVPLIDKKDWQALSEWLGTYMTEEPDYDVLNTFQEKTGHIITYLDK